MKDMKTTKDELFCWICEKHATDSFLDRRMIREKMLELTKERGVNNSFKCSNKWITNFLREYGFSVDLKKRGGPIFANYRDWIDLMRSTIVKYKHNDLFHVDELVMYSDVSPAKIGSPARKSSRNRVTVLLGCNSTGTTKLPLLVCGPYPSRTTIKDHVYSRSEDSAIDDKLFIAWLLKANDRMFRNDRKILLFLKRSRARALRDLSLSNVNPVYLPEDFPPFLRPLRRDAFHYVKMIFRRRYAERLKRHTSEWNLRDVLGSLIEAWEKLPREIVVHGFQRTRFRTDDCFVQIDCDCWPSLRTGVSFKRFVTFDDELSDERTIHEGNNHGYNLRASNKDAIRVKEDDANFTLVEDEETESREEECCATSSGLIEERSNDETNRVESPGDENRYERQEIPTESRKRAHSETPFSAKRRSLDRPSSADENHPPSAFRSKDPRVDRARSIDTEPFERTTLRRYRTEETGSLQRIIDKALTLTSSAKADFTRKLIDNIYASNQAATRRANCQTRSNDSCTVDDAESNRRCEDAIEETIPTNLSLESSLTASTSTDNRRTLSEAIARTAYEETIERGNGIPNPSTIVSQKTQQFSRQSCHRFKDSNDSSEHSDSDGRDEERTNIDQNWSKQYETTFVFGSSDASNPSSCSARQQQQPDENTGDSRIFNTTPRDEILPGTVDKFQRGAVSSNRKCFKSP
ncbi:uncharacterized protein LOC143154911 [Ptiloglossa arizonensis]|uniref:uncharacterized protein LOC143154911 n=1 Tax=Ptiloglossa arizonensis TaxID=3350558 RepID=UPI003F9EED03